MKPTIDLDALRFDKNGGTVVVVAQDVVTGRVLMVANADREALEHTIATGEMHYRSRTRGLWRKGATSGNVQKVIALTPDCDGDAVLARVTSAGPACHTGAVSCFADENAGNVWSRLAATIAERHHTVEEQNSAGSDTASGEKAERSSSYTIKLLSDRNLRLKKIGEESAELIAACADADKARAVEEAADLIYHTAVALQAVGSSLDEVAVALDRRGRVR